MSMTKKDFQLIAQAIADLSEHDFIREGKRAIAEGFADSLAATNPRFKRDLFVQAATGVVAVTARKARPQHNSVCVCEQCAPGLVRAFPASCPACHNSGASCSSCGFEARTLASDLAEDR